MNLLIHADPGARSGFLAAWLTNVLTSVDFDTGIALLPRYYKIHRLTDPMHVKEFNGIKIRIRPNINHIDLHSLLFLKKSVYPQTPDFTKDEYSLETFTKLFEFAKEIFQWDSELDYSLYGYVFDFADTFNTAKLQELYVDIVGQDPTNSQVDVMTATNKINLIPIDKNHACSILRMVMLREKELGLREERRFWSIVDLYNETPVNKLYDTIYNAIVPENYGEFLK